jgi:hypothetical protein
VASLSLECGKEILHQRPARRAWCRNIDPRPPPRKGRAGQGTAASIAALSGVIPSPTEDSMCWEMDYYWLAEQKKAEEIKAKQERRSDVIEKLLSDANRPADKPEEATPVKETIPAK